MPYYAQQSADSGIRMRFLRNFFQLFDRSTVLSALYALRPLNPPPTAASTDYSNLADRLLPPALWGLSLETLDQSAAQVATLRNGPHLRGGVDGRRGGGKSELRLVPRVMPSAFRTLHSEPDSSLLLFQFFLQKSLSYHRVSRVSTFNFQNTCGLPCVSCRVMLCPVCLGRTDASGSVQRERTGSTPPSALSLIVSSMKVFSLLKFLRSCEMNDDNDGRDGDSMTAS